MKNLSLTFLLTLCFFIPTGQAFSQSKQSPLEVSAQKTLEWNRAQKTYTARGKATAKQDKTEIHAETLTAHYADNSANTLTHITADTDISILSEGTQLTGQKGAYNILNGKADLTGNNLRIKTHADTVTARDKITYDTKRREMQAIGNAKAVRANETINADTLIARFTTTPNGQQKLHELEAKGNVRITTPTETLYSNHAIYKPDENLAQMTGDVRIERDQNLITGARAEIDLETHISKIFADENSDTRVRGVFYPE